MHESQYLQEVQVYFHPKLAPLFEPHRYKVCYGGRGGGKSWAVARAILIKGAEQPHRVLCAREFQSSISDSVHKLLSDQIYELGLDHFYEIEKSQIKGLNGTEIRFAGIKTNPSAIKSFEGITIAWIEEAQSVSKYSWETLIPTIRKEGSEIFITMNPELETDETYQRFIANPPPDSVVIKINYSDNPYFPQVLVKEAAYLKETDIDAYLNIWEGHPKSYLEGAVYAKELRKAQEDDRITTVRYDRSAPVQTFWDLGWRDSTSIIFAQTIAKEFRIIDFIEDSQRPIDSYIKQMQEKPYLYDTDFLPHDARAKSLGTGRSIEETLRNLGRKIQIVPKLSLEDGINAGRMVFDNCWFDKEKASDLIQALRKYRYDGAGRNPIHDDASHAADAFRYFAVSIKQPKPQTIITPKFTMPRTGGSGAWMSS